MIGATDKDGGYVVERAAHAGGLRRDDLREARHRPREAAVHVEQPPGVLRPRRRADPATDVTPACWVRSIISRPEHFRRASGLEARPDLTTRPRPGPGARGISRSYRSSAGPPRPGRQIQSATGAAENEGQAGPPGPDDACPAARPLLRRPPRNPPSHSRLCGPGRSGPRTATRSWPGCRARRRAVAAARMNGKRLGRLSRAMARRAGRFVGRVPVERAGRQHRVGVAAEPGHELRLLGHEPLVDDPVGRRAVAVQLHPGRLVVAVPVQRDPGSADRRPQHLEPAGSTRSRPAPRWRSEVLGSGRGGVSGMNSGLTTGGTSQNFCPYFCSYAWAISCEIASRRSAALSASAMSAPGSRRSSRSGRP